MPRAEWKYYHADFDEECLGLPLDEQTYLRIVCRLVDRLWSRKWRTNKWRWRRPVADDGFHHAYIEACRSKYKFPDYLELLGPPRPEHYDGSGELTVQRKAELLLIGVFDWRGLRVARHHALFGYKADWTWSDKPPYTREQKGWYVPIALKRANPKTPKIRDYFAPLRNYRCERLEKHLTRSEKYKEVIFRDGNRYNCHPANLEVVSTRGRRKQCVRCERRVTERTSRRMKYEGSTARFCLQCLADMGWLPIGEDVEDDL